VDNFLLAASARELGFNAIVMGSLHNIKESEEEKGIFMV
jgi:hypothetical protein